MEHTRTSYSAQEKAEIILQILSKKTTIQKVAKEKGIAATLISLWKKQALDAIEERFQAKPKGRPKMVRDEAPAAEQLKTARKETRGARIKAAHLETSLRETRVKLAAFENALKPLVAGMGYTLVKEKASRKPRKSRKA